MRRRRVGGTRRPVGLAAGGCGATTGVAATAVISIVAGSSLSGLAALSGLGDSVSSSIGSTGTDSSTFAAGAISAAGRSGSGDGRATSGSASGTTTGSAPCAGEASTGASASAAAGLIVLMSRGRSVGATDGGSGFPAFFATGVSANNGPVGRTMRRFRAWRSTNWRATISSIELEALFTSIPVSALRRFMASWLDRPSNSATL